MNEQYNNGFCPQCGALLRDGICPCCHYGENNTQNAYDSFSQSGFDSHQGGYDSGYGNVTQNGYDSSYHDSFYQTQIPQTKSKSSTIQAVIAGVIMAVVAIIAVAVTTVYSSSLPKSNDVADSDSDSYDDDWDYDWDDDSYEDDWDDYDWDDDSYEDTWDDEWSDSDYYDPRPFEDDIDWDDESWKEEPENYSKEDVWDVNHRYYEDLCSCIDENVSYQLSYKTEEQLDKDQDVCMRVTYYQLEGDIPNLDQINEQLKAAALTDLDEYNLEKEFYDEVFEKYGAGYLVDAKTYVTYNDDSLISFVTFSDKANTYMSGMHLYCVTVDLETGMVLDNMNMLDVDRDFVNRVVKNSNKQNGSISYLEDTDMDELLYEFENPENLIVFYTPCGLEVGLSYYSYYQYGWFSTTLTDYEKYLKSY
ncbi:MAG: hypothetical protein IIX48_02850 [Lachnospiraceae bacterium]|nr:hypothetical protein [Lachnospiraceae bacterium]